MQHQMDLLKPNYLNPLLNPYSGASSLSIAIKTKAVNTTVLQLIQTFMQAVTFLLKLI